MLQQMPFGKNMKIKSTWVSGPMWALPAYVGSCFGDCYVWSLLVKCEGCTGNFQYLFWIHMTGSLIVKDCYTYKTSEFSFRNYSCGMSVPVFGETTTSIPDECQRSSGRIGLACVSFGSPPCLVAGWLQPGCRAASTGAGLPKGQGDHFRSWLAALLWGGSQLPCVLQMLLRSRSRSNWLTSVMWSASLSTVPSSASPNGRWCCHGPHWLASACFTLPVDQKLVVGLEIRYGRLPHSL
jgi:hypothetical protein